MVTIFCEELVFPPLLLFPLFLFDEQPAAITRTDKVNRNMRNKCLILIMPHLTDILSEYVELQIDDAPSYDILEIRIVVGVRDYRY